MDQKEQQPLFKLGYQTRYGTDPTGKPLVFFACHPDDLDTYFDETAKDILAFQDCAFFCTLKDAEAEAEYANFNETEQTQILIQAIEFLSDMRLLVIAVTEKFLTLPSFARDFYEFLRINEIHIPVLALMQEGLMRKKELAALYNSSFGDLQFLEKHVVDVTSIPFEKKLEDYLSSVFVSDELIERIRNEFDAYIFLSYRKKDRAYAKKLMKLIHKNDFCRDIAIWYDEFLTPGEGFNGSIKAALEKSSLFVLAVTPSMLEDGNYVMTEEYPMARQIGKTILPAEIVPTDREELEKKYEGIPACTDANDEAELAAALSAALANVANLKNDSDPEHNFMIGLAYLTGIDVEVDVDRALEMIKSAAKSGVVDAVKKLADIYSNGDGVEYDPSLAAEWREELIKLLEQRYKESGSEDDGFRLADELRTLGHLLFSFGRLTESKIYYERARELMEKIRGQTDSDYPKCFLSTLYISLGEVAIQEHDFKKTQEYFETARKLTKECAEDLNYPPLTRQNLSLCYLRLSENSMYEGHLDEARRYSNEGLKIAADLAEEKKTPESRVLTALFHQSLGIIAEDEGQFDEALECYNKELDAYDALAAEPTVPNIRDYIAENYLDLGRIAELKGQLGQARAYYEESLKRYDELAEETKTPGVRFDQALLSSKLGEIYIAREQFTTALDYYKKALEIYAALTKEMYSTAALHHEIIVIYERFGRIAFAEGRLRDAKKYYERSLYTAEAIAGKEKTNEAICDVLELYNELGDTASEAGQLADALKYYEKALRLAVTLPNRNKRAEELLSACYEKLGSTAFANGRLRDAEKYYKRSLDIISPLAKKTNAINTLNAQERILNSLGDIYKAERRLDDERCCYEKAYDITADLVDRSEALGIQRDFAIIDEKSFDMSYDDFKLGDSPEFNKMREQHIHGQLENWADLSEMSEAADTRSGLARSCDRLGNFYRSNGQLDRAREYYEKALRIRELLAKRSETVRARLDPSLSYDKLGDTARDAGQTDEARAYYNKALGIRLALASETNLAAVARALALSYENLGDADKEEWHLDCARGYYDKALGIMTALAEKTKTVETRRGLALIYEKLASVDEEDFCYDEALESYEKALRIREELEKELDSAEARSELFPIYDKIGGIFEYQGPPENVRGYFEKSLDIKAKLVKDSETKEAKLELLRGCIRLGDLVFDEDQTDDARKYYKEAYDTASKLAMEERSAEVLYELSRVCGGLSQTARAEGNYDEARKYLIKSHEIKIELADEAKTTEERTELALSYDVLGSIAKEENRFDDAKAYYIKLFKLRTALEKEEDTPKARRNVHLCLCDLGETARRQKHFEEARDYFKRALDLAVALTKETKDPAARLDELFCIGNLGSIAIESGHRDEARDLFEKALKLGRELEQALDDEGRTEARRHNFVSCDHLGQMEKEDGRTESARAYYAESYIYAITVAEEMKTDQSYHELAFAHYNLGTLDYPQIDADHIIAAREIWESLANSHPENNKYVSMRDMCRQLLEQ